MHRMESEVVFPVLPRAEAPEPPGLRSEVLSVQDGVITRWGMLPLLSLTSAVGLLLVALAFTQSRAAPVLADSPTSILFWAGLLVMIAPIAWRLYGVQVSRTERLGLVALLTLGLYLVKVVHSPLAFTFPDEMVFVYNTNQVNQDQRLFHENPVLPVTPRYPGLSIAANALVSLTGLSTFEAGIYLIGAARLILILGLFLFHERLSGSPRLAGMAALVYASNPNFVFWSAEFSYESLALPLAVVVLFLVARRVSSEAQVQPYLTGLAGILILAVAVTHHLTSFALIAFLGAAALLYRKAPVFRQPELRPLGLLAFSVLVVGGWLILAAPVTIEYLLPVLRRAFESFLSVAAGSDSGRQLFQSSAGYVAPAWERAVGFGSVALLAAAAPVGLYHIYKRLQGNTLALVLALGGGAYFPLLLLRFTPYGWETSNRSSEFLFVGLSFVTAAALAGFWNLNRANRIGNLFAAGFLSIVFLGGLVSGWQPNVRMARPYIVEASSRLIEPEGIAAARWMLAHVGPGQKVAIDAENAKTLLAYGEQYPLTGSKYGIQYMLFSPKFSEDEQYILQVTGVRYILVSRASTWDQMIGHYFTWESDLEFAPRDPMEPYVYNKLDNLPEISKIFDSGNLAIYDVGAFLDDPAQP
jgi:hypothetical protein